MASRPTNDLFNKYIKGECSDEEKEIVEGWYAYYLKNSTSPEVDWKRIVNRSNSTIYQVVSDGRGRQRESFWRIAAAMLIFFTIGMSVAVWVLGPSLSHRGDSLAMIYPAVGKGYVKINGQTFDLVSEHNVLSLSPESVNLSSATIPLHTGNMEGNDQIYIKAPLAGNYRVNLFDGSSIVLNSGAELFVPKKFSVTNRWVRLEGEGYFDIAKSQGGMGSFEIDVAGHRIEVLGTTFNINAGKHLPDIRISLHTGTIKVDHGKGYEVLQQGDNYTFNRTTGQYVVDKKAVNQSDIAWTKDEFVFDRRSLRTIARELSEWYDFDILIGTSVDTSETFTGILARNRNLQQVLDILNMNKQYEYNIDIPERRVIIEKKGTD